MANIQAVKRNGKLFYRKQFYLLDGTRTTIWLGSSKKRAEAISIAIDDLLDVKRFGIEPSAATKAMLQCGDKTLIALLSKRGLCRPIINPTLADFVAEFIDGKRASSSAATIVTFENVKKHLAAFFPSGTLLANVSPTDATRFAEWLVAKDGGKLKSANTARRRTGIARQIFNRAVDLELITRNPFKHLKVGQSAAKKRYITIGELTKILDKCPTQEWRALFAMARYLGPRIPSEVATMVWGDVDWERNTILIRSPKTAGHGKAERLAPILPDLSAELQALFNEINRPSQADSVFPTLRHHSNLSTTARKFVERARVPSWEKFWNAFRASAACDLMDRFGLRKACGWMGHSAAVALKNYSLTKATDFADVGSKQFDAHSYAAPAHTASTGVTIPPVCVDSPSNSGVLMGDEGPKPAAERRIPGATSGNASGNDRQNGPIERDS